MRFRRFLCLLSGVCLILPTLFGCAGIGTESPVTTEPETVSPETPTEAETQPPAPVLTTYSVSENLQYIKQVGRCTVVDGSIAADWTASGIEFEFQGSGVLKFRAKSYGSGYSIALIATVDGKDYPVTVTAGSRVYQVASNLQEGKHHVLIRRKTMVEKDLSGTMLQFNEIQMCGTFLQKPADNTYQVAFLGDSITCGVGISSSEIEGLDTYAIDLCTREGFDYDICSVSGIGVYMSTGRHGGTANTMTKYYPYYNYYRSDSLRYTPNRQADLVVVNLNTNDQYQTGGASAHESNYKATLKTLISEIRAAHGNDVKIVWIVGMMVSETGTVNQWLKEVFDELGGESAGLYRLAVDKDNGGAEGHPNKASHIRVSRALSAFIREKNLLVLS